MTDDAPVKTVEIVYDGRRVLKDYDADGRLVRMRVEPLPPTPAPEPEPAPAAASVEYAPKDASSRARKAAAAFRRTIVPKEPSVRSVPVEEKAPEPAATDDEGKRALRERLRERIQARRAVIDKLKFPTRSEEGAPPAEESRRVEVTAPETEPRATWRVIRQDVIVNTAPPEPRGRARGTRPAEAGALTVEVPPYEPEAPSPEPVEEAPGLFTRLKARTSREAEPVVEVEPAEASESPPTPSAPEKDADPKPGVLARFKRKAREEPAGEPDPEAPPEDAQTPDEAPPKRGLLSRFKREAAPEPEAPHEDASTPDEPSPKRELLSRFRRKADPAPEAEVTVAPEPESAPEPAPEPEVAVAPEPEPARVAPIPRDVLENVGERVDAVLAKRREAPAPEPAVEAPAPEPEPEPEPPARPRVQVPEFAPLSESDAAVRVDAIIARRGR